jgi:hypothetical protein
VVPSAAGTSPADVVGPALATAGSSAGGVSAGEQPGGHDAVAGSGSVEEAGSAAGSVAVAVVGSVGAGPSSAADGTGAQGDGAGVSGVVVGGGDAVEGSVVGFEATVPVW